MKAKDATIFYAVFAARISGKFLHNLGDFHTQLHWRERKKNPLGENYSSGENSPKVADLSLVMVERVLSLGAKKSTQTFLYKVFRQPFGSWTSAPKIVDVRTQKCVFLRPRWWGETFCPWASGRKGQECPREIRTKKFMFMLFFSSLRV